jgi:hypothetical protein
MSAARKGVYWRLGKSGGMNPALLPQPGATRHFLASMERYENPYFYSGGRYWYRTGGRWEKSERLCDFAYYVRVCGVEAKSSTTGVIYRVMLHGQSPHCREPEGAVAVEMHPSLVRNGSICSADRRHAPCYNVAGVSAPHSSNGIDADSQLT